MREAVLRYPYQRRRPRGTGPILDRYRQLIRCLRMVQERAYQREATGDHLRALAMKHKVSTRTIRRDLQALREAGYGFVPWSEVDIPRDVTL